MLLLPAMHIWFVLAAGKGAGPWDEDSVDAGHEAGTAGAIARVSLVALPLVLPFEAPLFQLGPLLITTAEVALYLVLAAWGAHLVAKLVRARGRSPSRGEIVPEPLVWAAALWLAIVVVSALAAPAHRAAAVKFALRTGSGVLLFFAARDLARSPRWARRVVQAIVAGAALSALGAVVETALPGSVSLWQPFRPQAFTALGLARASGAFAYPTIAAMYWEAAVPLAVAAFFGTTRGLDRAPPWVGGALVTALAGLLVVATLLSATRSALVGAAVASGALLILGWRAGIRLRLAAGGTLAVTALLVALVLRPGDTQSLLGQRLQWWRDGSWFGARYLVSPPRLVLSAGKLAGIPVTVQNVGVVAWPHAGRDPVHLSYHWEAIGRGQSRLVQFEGRRTRLGQDVAPGATVQLVGVVEVPAAPGRYRLRWDLVRESVTWFSERGNPTADQLVDVVVGASVAPTGNLAELASSSLPTWVTPPTATRTELWRAAVQLWRQHPVLGIGPDNFRRRYPEALALAPGERRFNDERLHANSFYFETLADLGLIGMLALGLVILALVRAVRAHAARGRLVALACGVAAGTFFVHGLLDTFLAFTPLCGLYWLLLGLTSRPAPPGSSP
jgi:hypothetical protein